MSEIKVNTISPATGTNVAFSTGNLVLGNTGSVANLMISSGTGEPAADPRISLYTTNGIVKTATAYKANIGGMWGEYIGPISGHGLGLLTSNATRLWIDATGNIGIGTTTPLSKLHIKDGGICYQRTGKSTRVYSNLGNWFYEENSGNATGIVEIAIPSNGWKEPVSGGNINTMLDITIDGRNYVPSASWTVKISAYFYAAGTQWHSSSAQIIGRCPFSTVRLGFNNTTQKPVILLGETNTVLSYPDIRVSSVSTSYSNTESPIFSSEWVITGLINSTSNYNLTYPGSTPVVAYSLDTSGIPTFRTKAIFGGLTSNNPYGAGMGTLMNGIQLRGALVFQDQGGDSGLSGTVHPYGLYQEGGAWSGTYPDYRLDAHTGLKIVAGTNYRGTRFYSSYLDTSDSEILFSVGDTDSNVRVRDRLLVSGTTVSTSTTTGALTVAGGLGVGGIIHSAGLSSSAILSCATAPTEGQHLANKTYVDSRYRVGATVIITGTNSGTGSPAVGAPTNWAVSQSSTTFSITIPTAATNATTGGGTWAGSLITRGSGGACDMWPLSVVGNGTAVNTTVTNTAAQGFTIILVRTA